jgi:hypothetical protein
MQRRRVNFEQEKQVPINWRRGMFRLWILASSAWAMGWLIFFTVEVLAAEISLSQLIAAPVILIGPPIALLLFGVAARWAFLGFYTDDSPAPGVDETKRQNPNIDIFPIKDRDR